MNIYRLRHMAKEKIWRGRSNKDIGYAYKNRTGRFDLANPFVSKRRDMLGHCKSTNGNNMNSKNFQ